MCVHPQSSFGPPPPFSTVKDGSASQNKLTNLKIPIDGGWLWMHNLVFLTKDHHKDIHVHTGEKSTCLCLWDGGCTSSQCWGKVWGKVPEKETSSSQWLYIQPIIYILQISWIFIYFLLFQKCAHMYIYVHRVNTKIFQSFLMLHSICLLSFVSS